VEPHRLLIYMTDLKLFYIFGPDRNVDAYYDSLAVFLFSPPQASAPIGATGPFMSPL